MSDTEEWFTLDSISESSNQDTLYCISVDSAEKQFLVGENIHVPTHNTDEGKEEDGLKGEAAMLIGSIARLGRAAGVHLVVATQRPDATIIAGETKANLGARVCCGNVGGNASSMILDSSEGTRVKSSPKGRIFVKIFDNGNHAQGFFASNEWAATYFESKGLKPDGTPIHKEPSRLAEIAKKSPHLNANDHNNESDDTLSDEEVAELLAESERMNTEEHDESEPSRGEDRPELGKKSSSKHRAEDDWDDVMDEIHEANRD